VFSVVSLSFALSTTTLAQPLTPRADAVVVVNSASAEYTDFQHFLQPYLDNFGVPYTLLDIATTSVETNVEDYALIIIGHRQLDVDGLHLDAAEQSNITHAVSGGTGLVNFDNDISADGSAARYQFIDDAFGFGYTAAPTASGITITSAGHSGTSINCWNDANQSPVLATTENVGNLLDDDGEWTEFLYTAGRPYPSVMAGVDEDLLGLPVMRFYSGGISNGEYEVVANLYTASAGRDMRYYYGYTSSTPKALHVDTLGGAGGSDQHEEYSLGTVSITNGTFNIYVQDAELTGTGTYPYFGWASIKLVAKVAQGGTEELHYITERHEVDESIDTGSMTLAGITLPAGVMSLAYVESHPFLAVTTHGLGKAVQWATYDWMSHAVKGPVYKLDDLLWRSLVWAARKPFVMQGMPHYVTMRVDDESGPLSWIDVANEFAIKPFAAVFMDDIDATEAVHLSTLVNAGQATASIHAFSYNDSFYYNHGSGPLSDEIIAANFAEGAQWYLDNNIPCAKTVLPHYYEIGANTFQGLSDWGVEFVGTHMIPGDPYTISPWLMLGPFRHYETGLTRDTVPLYYADYLPIPGHPEFDGQFFNCVTEIRDDAGYEWNLTADIPLSIGRGTRQVKRGFDSMTLATLFTHGQRIFGITDASWREILEGITENLASYEPLYVTHDYGVRYVRAMHTSDITNSVYNPDLNQLTTTISGSTDMATMFYLFTEHSGEIIDAMIDVPPFAGSTQVIIQLRGDIKPFTFVNIDLQASGGTTYTGRAAAPDAVGNTYWNAMQSVALSNLKSSDGRASALDITISDVEGWYAGSGISDLTKDRAWRRYDHGDGIVDFTISGLKPGKACDIYLYAGGNLAGHAGSAATDYTIGGVTKTAGLTMAPPVTTNGAGWIRNDHYVIFSNVEASGTGAISGRYTANNPVEGQNVYGCLAGMQIGFRSEPKGTLMILR